jgi:hypothetical protein
VRQATSHGYNQVSNELKKMAEENPRVAWIEELWRSMSGSAHMSDYDYMLSAGPDGAVVIDYPPGIFAANSFNKLLPLVGEMAALVRDVTGADVTVRHNTVLALLADPFLVELRRRQAG